MKRMLIHGVLMATLVAAATVPGHARMDVDPGRERATRSVAVPSANVDWDYQIGGVFPPAASVGLVSRDRAAAPSAGDYNVCYVNAFQTQPDERSFWKDDQSHWALVLRRSDGRAVIDGEWGEWLLDTRTRATRRSLLRIVGRWIDGCAASGFQGIEFDNLDSWARSSGLLSERDNRAYARMLTARAHAAGLAAGQKNWAELSPQGPGLGFDFAIAEECGRYRECGTFARAYGDRVYVVEYRDQDFTAACRRWGSRLSIVLRDVDVSVRGTNQRC